MEDRSLRVSEEIDSEIHDRPYWGHGLGDSCGNTSGMGLHTGYGDGCASGSGIFSGNGDGWGAGYGLGIAEYGSGHSSGWADGPGLGNGNG